jgi:diaminohydroxyphosphoribosylaminopyrimidine deaminase/5-amino-6-(5-phosphoribosylamino)uracil reductase
VTDRFTPAEHAAMARAIQLSALGEATTKPNPNVGAVVLDASGQVVGEGWHRRAGESHAEIHALRAAGERARGGTLVVTLEPCNHAGRTPPCARAVIDAGVGRVVFSVADPNAVAAGGALALQAAGVEVDSGLLAPEAERANERWLTAVRLGRPYVVWKYAATLDGRVAAADGTSRWITGPESRADVHRLRAACDVIMAGVGTVVADDPQLTVRDEDGNPLEAQPLRVVVDTEGRTPAGARVRDANAPTWVASAAEVGRDADGRVDLHALLKRLRDDGRQFVLLEGGPTLAGAFLRAGLVDRVVGYVAPALLGAGPAALEDAGITTISQALRLDIDDVRRIGPDVRISARVPRKET